MELHTNWWPESEDFLELKQMTSDKTAFPRCPDHNYIPSSHCLLWLSLMERKCFFLPTLVKREMSSFDYGLLETTLWSGELCLKDDKVSIHKSLFWTATKLLVLTQIHGFWIYSFTSILLITHLLPKSPFEKTIPFLKIFEVLQQVHLLLLHVYTFTVSSQMHFVNSFSGSCCIHSSALNVALSGDFQKTYMTPGLFF